MGSGGALLAAQGVFVLRCTRNAVAPADDFSRLDHLDIGGGHGLQHRLRLRAVAVLVLVLHHRDRLQATGHGNVHLARHDAFGGGGNGHQARGAHAVNHHAAHALGQAGGVSAQAAQVVALVALLGGNAQDDVIDLVAGDAGLV